MYADARSIPVHQCIITYDTNYEGLLISALVFTNLVSTQLKIIIVICSLYLNDCNKECRRYPSHEWMIQRIYIHITQTNFVVTCHSQMCRILWSNYYEGIVNAKAQERLGPKIRNQVTNIVFPGNVSNKSFSWKLKTKSVNKTAGWSLTIFLLLSKPRYQALFQ